MNAQIIAQALAYLKARDKWLSTIQDMPDNDDEGLERQARELVQLNRQAEALAFTVIQAARQKARTND